MALTIEREVTATCGKCQDMFSMVIIDRRGEMSIEPSQSIGFVKGELTHRPLRCGGRITLVGKDPMIHLTGLHQPTTQHPVRGRGRLHQ